MSGTVGASAKQRGAEANLGGAFFNGNSEILGHAHGKLGERPVQEAGHFITQLAEAPKNGAHFLQVGEHRRHRHQAAQLQMRHQEHAFSEAREGVRLAAGFFGRGIETNFDKHGEPAALPGGMIELFGQREIIERIHGVKQGESARRLISLRVADEMPDGREILHHRQFGLELLHSIFAEVTHAGVESLADALGGKVLRNTNERDFVSAAAGSLSGKLEAFANFLEVTGDRAGRFIHGANSNRSAGRVGCEAGGLTIDWLRA